MIDLERKDEEQDSSVIQVEICNCILRQQKVHHTEQQNKEDLRTAS
jgi:hypothetical protein